MSTERPSGASDLDLDLDIFANALFSEARTGGVQFLIDLAARRARVAESVEQNAVREVSVRFVPGFSVELSSVDEAERLVQELGELFARSGVELDVSRKPPASAQ